MGENLILFSFHCSGILLTMCYYAHKFWWQKALPETEKLTAVGVAMSGWIYTFRGLGPPEEPKKRIMGIPRGVFWTIWYTTISSPTSVCGRIRRLIYLTFLFGLVAQWIHRE